MLETSLLYLLVVVAVGIGWWLGRNQTRHVSRNDYPEDKRYFLAGKIPQDSAVSSFISTLEVNNETLETHMSLASLLRRRGEVDNAVKVHENLLSRAQLNHAVLLEVKLELAKDYLHAGLLDRAERLLKELQEEKGEICHQALEYLVEIYAREREWQKAIDAALQLQGRFKAGDYTSLRLAHFHCELAEQARDAGDLARADLGATRAFQVYPGCVRASLLKGSVEYERDNPRLAAEALEHIRQQDVRYVPMSLSLLEKCYTSAGLNPERLIEFLKLCLEQEPAVSVVLTLSRIEQRQHGKTAASRYLSTHLKDHPTLRGLTELIDMHISDTEGAARQNLTLLRSFAEALLAGKPSYRCRECGFSAKRIHWCCPTCRQWGSVDPIYGLEGE